MRKIKPGAPIHFKNAAGRIRHGIVVTVTNQNSITARVGRTLVSLTRAASTTTRGSQFNA